MRFTDKVLFTTGGGSGLAATVARQFVAEGGRVAIADLDADRAAAVAAECGGGLSFGLDVRDEEAVAAAVAQTASEFGGIHAVFAAAGHAEFDLLEDWSMDRWRLMMDVHAGGTFLTCKYTVPVLRASGGGAIVAVSSVAAFTAQNKNAPYGAAKGAIVSFCRQLAREIAPDIRINVIAPGRTRSGMTEPLMIERAGSVEAGSVMFGAGNLQKRVAEPQEIARPVCFLLSEEASFITGATLIADGGETVL